MSNLETGKVDIKYKKVDMESIYDDMKPILPFERIYWINYKINLLKKNLKYQTCVAYFSTYLLKTSLTNHRPQPTAQKPQSNFKTKFPVDYVCK